MQEGDLLGRFGDLGFFWPRDSTRIELHRIGEDGRFPRDGVPAVGWLEPYHFLGDMSPVRRNTENFRIFCEEFRYAPLNAKIVDGTPDAAPQPDFTPQPGFTPAEPIKHTLMGTPLEEIAALTLDGAHWLEVLGPISFNAPAGGPVFTFRIAQAPGGKNRKLGIGQGDVITVSRDAIRGIQRKSHETLGPVVVREVG